MSLKIEIADWRFEITWDGMLCTPLERNKAKATAGSNGSQYSRRSINNRNNQSMLKVAHATSALGGSNLIKRRKETK